MKSRTAALPEKFLASDLPPRIRFRSRPTRAWTFRCDLFRRHRKRLHSRARSITSLLPSLGFVFGLVEIPAGAARPAALVFR
jgi:hypothetical protein